jgi:hypothetical protein
LASSPRLTRIDIHAHGIGPEFKQVADTATHVECAPVQVTAQARIQVQAAVGERKETASAQVLEVGVVTRRVQ